MKTALIIWGVVILICFLEAYFYTKIDPESKEFLNKREKWQQED